MPIQWWFLEIEGFRIFGNLGFKIYNRKKINGSDLFLRDFLE